MFGFFCLLFSLSPAYTQASYDHYNSNAQHYNAYHRRCFDEVAEKKLCHGLQPFHQGRFRCFLWNRLCYIMDSASSVTNRFLGKCGINAFTGNSIRFPDDQRGRFHPRHFGNHQLKLRPIIRSAGQCFIGVFLCRIPLLVYTCLICAWLLYL